MYYFIRDSMNTKIVGKFFQSETIAWNYGNIDNPRLLNNIYFEKIDFNPIVPIPILHKKAKITDLISCVNATSSGQLIISEQLKNIISKYRTDGLQFFTTSIIKDNLEYNNFYALNMYKFNNDYIDFTKSVIIHNRKADDYKSSFMTVEEQINFENFQQFDEKRIQVWSSREEIILIEKLKLHIENIKEDFFMIKYVFGGTLFVSDKLKKEIEDAGCTGIEFQPIELSYNEWTAPGGERERVYGKA